MPRLLVAFPAAGSAPRTHSVQWHFGQYKFLVYHFIFLRSFLVVVFLVSLPAFVCKSVKFYFFIFFFACLLFASWKLPMLRNLWEQVQSVRSIRSDSMYCSITCPESERGMDRGRERDRRGEREGEENTRRRERVNFALNAICFLFLL